MDDRRVTLPDDLSSIEAAGIAGYSVDPDALTVRLWIDRHLDGAGPVRVFTSEAVDTVTVLVVPTPPKYLQGYCGDWTSEDMAADVADVIAKLAAPLGDRPLVNAHNGAAIEPLPQWILDRCAEHPAPRLRPIGAQADNDPLTFRGEL